MATDYANYGNSTSSSSPLNASNPANSGYQSSTPVRGGRYGAALARGFSRAKKSRAGQATPPHMTWGKATPILILCSIFDALRFMCEQLWFFGPVLVGTAAGVATGSSIVGVVAGLIGGGLETITGPTLEIFGVVLAMTIAALGSMIVNFLLFLTNPRIFKDYPMNALWALFGFGVSFAPILGTAPGLFYSTWKMYSAQIKKEKADFKKWQATQAAMQKQDSQQRLAEQYAALNFRNTQEMELRLRMEQQDADQEEERRALEEIPERVRESA